jgi:hypothetical protein
VAVAAAAVAAAVTVAATITTTTRSTTRHRPQNNPKHKRPTKRTAIIITKTHGISNNVYSSSIMLCNVPKHLAIAQSHDTAQR